MCEGLWRKLLVCFESHPTGKGRGWPASHLTLRENRYGGSLGEPDMCPLMLVDPGDWCWIPAWEIKTVSSGAGFGALAIEQRQSSCRLVILWVNKAHMLPTGHL